MPDLAAIILAAGGSSRFGRPKQLAEVDGVALLRRAVGVAVEASCKSIVVVVGRDADACRSLLADLGPDVVVVTNADWERGLGTSLRTGVRTLLDIGPTDAAFLLLGDQPRVSADTLRKVIETRTESACPIAVAAYADTVGPPVLVDRATLDRLRDWPDDRGAKSLWTDQPDHVARVDCPEAAHDIDTPDDLRQFTDAHRPAGGAA